MEKNFRPQDILVDKGFDSDFEWSRILELCNLFSDDRTIQSYIYKMHEEDNAFDLKRGEFYPELLRALISLKRSVGAIYGIDLIQVQPNYGSNGSIDTILGAVKVEETRRLAQTFESTKDAIRGALDAAKGKPSNDSAISPILEKALRESETTGGALFTSPTYFRNYNSASAKNLAVHLVPLTEKFEFDAPAFIKAMSRIHPSVVFLVTPNNPTGLPIADEDICSVLDALPSDTWAVIDRTLVNTRPEIPTRDLLHRYSEKNVIVLHSFSKYRGMSHQRIGVALYSNPTLSKLVLPHLPLGIGLEGCLKANRIVLEENGIFPSEHILSNVLENNRLLREFVSAHPNFAYTDFSGNYCLVVLPESMNSATVTDTLRANGLYVMGGHDFPEPQQNQIRLHVGGPPIYIENLCDVLAREVEGTTR